MSRSLLVSAIAAVTLCGLWGLAARSSSLQPARPDGPVELTEPATAEVPVAKVVTPAVPRSNLATVSNSRLQAPKRETHAASAPAAHRFRSAMRITPEGEAVPPEAGPALTIEEMQAVVRQETAGLVTILNPDGSETLNHDGRFVDYSIIRIGPDGKPTFQCVQGEAALKRAFAPSAAGSATKGGK